MSPPPPVAIDAISTLTMNPETASCSGSSPPPRRFGDLRGVQWRIDLGILPSSQSASIDDLRRVTANSRRRYAALRRQLLVDPHVPKDGSNSPDLVIDNPLSQNPDSMWGRFFRNAELERMVDQDLTRLYPKSGSYFQTTGCQGMLRRILLLWCLRHPEHGYGQGMHELLAPLLYVLHEDVERLSEVRKVYDDHFADKFDGFSFHEDDLTYKFDFKKFSDSVGDGNGFENSFTKPSTLSELDPEIQNIVSLSDAYGAEGELGIVLSEKFMEHDAYSMFDALMSGASGAVAMAEFFSPSPFKSSHSGFPPVIEASAAMYHLLSIVDSSLHSHLVELGVEPQYFALRWLRVLFGREFSLEDLLVIWDEIFACENTKSTKDGDSDAESSFGVLESPRGAFISAFAVSMILYLRSSLFATENATVCLQRLLNFPNDVKLDKLVAKAKSLQSLAMDTKNSSSLSIYHELYNRKKPVIARGHSLSMDSTSPRTPLNMVSESYWEEKWRVLHKEEEKKKSAVGEEQVQKQQRGWSERVKIRLSRTESDPSPSSKNNGINKRIPKPSVRRSLLEDLARQLGSDEVKENSGVNKDIDHKDPEEINDGEDSSDKLLARLLGSDEVEQNSEINEDIDHQDSVENNGRDSSDKNLVATLSGAGSEENSSNYSDPQSSIHGESGHENESGRSSVASNSTFDENYLEPLCGAAQECSPLPVSDPPDEGLFSTRAQNDDSVEKSEKGMKERNFLSGKFQWLWKFARNGDEGTSERINAPEDAKAIKGGSVQSNLAGICHGNGSDSSFATSKGDSVDQNLMVSLKNLGQSMLENIQVIESAFQQEHRGQTENLSKNGIVGKGQVTAMAALKELRKMSNLLSEM